MSHSEKSTLTGRSLPPSEFRPHESDPETELLKGDGASPQGLPSDASAATVPPAPGQEVFDQGGGIINTVEPRYEFLADRIQLQVVIGHYKVFPDGRSLKIGEAACQPMMVYPDDTADGARSFIGGVALTVQHLETQARKELAGG